MADIALVVIQEYMEECFFEPSIGWPQFEFDRRIYSRWAANEISRRIQEDPEADPLDILSQFINEMDEYSEMGDDRSKQFIFVVAREMAEELALLFV